MTHTAYAHFIGVGGAGMSGLARVLHDRGLVVTGSDLKSSRYARALEEAGVTVDIGHDATHLGDPEVVVISSAIPDSNPELAAARERGIEIWPRAKMLAHIARQDLTLAVAGTHGKTTTSSMLAHALDGMGHEHARRALETGRFPSLSRLAHEGYLGPSRPSSPVCQTPPALLALFTGAEPRQAGLVQEQAEEDQSDAHLRSDAGRRYQRCAQAKPGRAGGVLFGVTQLVGDDGQGGDARLGRRLRKPHLLGARIVVVGQLPGDAADAHVLQGIGTAMVSMRPFTGPEDFMESLREADILANRKSVVYLTALKRLQTTLDRVLPRA